MAIFHSGKNATVMAGTATANAELAAISFTVNEGAETAEWRNSKTGKFTVMESTFASCTFTINLDLPTDANPFVAANGGLSIIASQTNAVCLVLDKTSAGSNTVGGNNYNFPSAQLLSTTLSTSVEGKPQLTTAWKASGAWNPPVTLT